MTTRRKNRYSHVKINIIHKETEQDSGEIMKKVYRIILNSSSKDRELLKGVSDEKTK